MNRKAQLIQFGKVVAVGLILVAGANFAWVGPTQAPTGDDAPPPLHIGQSNQSKVGSLVLGSANTTTETLDVYGASRIAGGVISIDDITVGGKLSVGPSGSTVTPSGNSSELDVTGSILSYPLRQANNSGVSYDAPLCANTLGEIILCP